MTRTPTPPPRKPVSRDSSNSELTPKPYKLISFPKERPTLRRPVGHHKYLSDSLHGTLYLTLTVQTSLHISTGVVALGSDINSKVSLVKTMVQGVDQKLSIQGSSLKGCIRCIYEGITNSTLAIVTKKYKDNNKIPQERLPCGNKEKLCPASRVFGALDWQGLLDFNDATCTGMDFSTGFMPSLYRPSPDKNPAYFINGQVAGRKFYYNTNKAIDKGQNSGIAVQQAGREYSFITELHFKNLLSEELGTLLIALGQDPKYPMALKVGGGKPIGMGTMTVSIDKITQFQDLKRRYSSYELSSSDELMGDNLAKFKQKHIQAAHSGLIEKTQLEELAAILRYPSDRQPPTGMY
ncbi:RAMP superfamily CRISPR-associated protein [Umezakia ovalisporum]|uniref:RAMP superfamily CRISPR-associated protein n=1 Tax=Umezakia ovalisporum FSS-43 TaxID=2740520 RepID=A0ABT6K191_9CYAN|nr:RAMP superfamily CRISPR-associated protein [Umezakia ovalisporum]MDH6055971.1 RAMP superfamily CRISPR-associated protein [Umezakia ovalisporum FSS-43]MDH6066135.1 RAMP superfamily CRISPR-associated protein [Umezakia ovalisporum APH033B]MDH6072603.1 RAMP superfamily CRISPR-associated protein [Umezakia ovalisporum CobakiLakeA]MDH6074113.1 RAMP superfamily CRISPR-associated protein [Umezakia ovalisporum CS-1034]MDH6079015.1 RAMP superfamily CRISPR-associated protein [Umezakia ovalisporum FSS-4